MKKINLICLFLFISHLVFSQQERMTEFSTDTKAFIEELEKVMRDTKRDDLKETITQFKKLWLARQFDDNQQQDIIKTFNLMLGRKMVPYPYYDNYLKALINFPLSKLSNDELDNWLKITIRLTEKQKKGNNKNFQEFMDFSIPFFANNYIYDSKAKSWVSSSKEFKLEFDSVPKISFSSLDLFAITKGDSIYIHETQGTYFPITNEWIGYGGIVDWKRAGLNPDEVFVKINKYVLNLKESGYTLDSVFLSYNTLLKTPLMGRLQDKLMVDATEEKISYPKFESYTPHLKIDNIAPKVKYEGGLSLYGAKIVGRGDKNVKAVMRFYTMNDRLAIISRSKQFSIVLADAVFSKEAETTVYVDKDSIYHPGLEMKFNLITRELVLTRGTAGVSATNFSNSFQNVEMAIDRINWVVGDSLMKLDNITAKAQRPARFESINFFEKGQMDKFQGISDFNPVHLIKKYSEENKTREMDAGYLAKRMGPKFDIESIRRLLYQLVQEGYIYYNQDIELVTIRDKTINYVLANAKLIDYDIIRVLSATEDANATLNTTNNTLNVKGVSDVMLSDSQFVVIFPKDRVLKIKRDRDMEFNGSMFAGRMDIYGNNFNFKYSPFKMGLSKIDSFLVNIPGSELDEYGKPKLIPLRTLIENFSGTISIDESDNKSGKSNINPAIAKYPIFESVKESYAYYHKPYILNNVYPREKFFFRLNPFVRDSMDTFNPSTLQFAGTMVSAGIFPDFKEKIRIMPDLSLGFVTKTPAEGYPMYGGKGKYQQTISLSNMGFRGKGNFKYKAATTYSQDIIFYPDSLNSNSDSVIIDKSTVDGLQFPSARGTYFYTHWMPYQDTMLLKIKIQPFEFVEWKATLKGDMIIGPTGFEGNGIMDWENAVMVSKKHMFHSNDFDADTASLQMKALDPKDIAFNAPNVKAHVDFKKRTGEFKSNVASFPAEFPYNQYITSINEFEWEMDNKVINFKAPASGALFTSTRPDQDSLSFSGSGASYNMKTYLLEIKGIPFIQVADAKIIPDTGRVNVEREAVMQTLTNAKIDVDTVTHYHQFNKATVNIYGKKNYVGYGSKDYVNITKIPQPIFFDSIYVTNIQTKKKSDLVTNASGNIGESPNFFLSPKVLYKGKVKMVANQKYLEFKGQSRLQIEHPKLASEWFNLSDVINPDSMFITINENTKNENGRQLLAGVWLTMEDDSLSLYSTFLGTKGALKDDNIFQAQGLLEFNQPKSEFRIGDENKMKKGALRGNLIAFNDKTGKIYCEGKIDMVTDINASEVAAAGTINNDLNADSYAMDIVLGLKFEFDDEIVKKMANDFLDLTTDLPDLNYSKKPNFLKAIIEFVDPKDEKTEKKVLDDFSASGIFVKPPKKLEYTFLLTDLNMVWYPETQSFQSRGRIGVAYIGESAINKMMVGYVEFGTRKGSNYFNMYLQPGLATNWYFFEYKNSVMNISSSNADFVMAVSNIKDDRRRIKDGDKVFFYQGTESERGKDRFIERMKEVK